MPKYLVRQLKILNPDVGLLGDYKIIRARSRREAKEKYRRKWERESGEFIPLSNIMCVRVPEILREIPEGFLKQTLVRSYV